MKTNTFPIPYFEVDKKEMKQVNSAFWGIIMLSLYNHFFLPLLSAHGGNALIMLFAPIINSFVFKILLSITYIALTTVLYNAVRIQLRRRHSWGQWVCAVAIGAMIANCIINFIIIIRPENMPNLYNGTSLLILKTTTGLSLIANFAILVLSVFLFFRGSGHLRIAGIIYIVSFIIGIVIGEFGLFYNTPTLQVITYISLLFNLLFLIFLRLSFRLTSGTSIYNDKA